MKLAGLRMRAVQSDRSVQRGGERGFALMIVLLVLLALLVLCTPFLMSARNADRASVQLSDRAAARIGLDAASRHARQFLSDTYPSVDLDKTPYYDSLDEIRVTNAFDSKFFDANDPNGPMWDIELQDVAGLIDLNSAGPQMLANMMGVSTRFAQVIPENAKELALSSATGFEPTGFLVVEGETIHYTKLTESVVTEFMRGMFGPPAKTEWRGGPRPAVSHGVGASVIDQRAFAPCLWRLKSDDGELHTFAALEELPQAGMYARTAQLGAVNETNSSGAAQLDAELVRPLLAMGTVHAGPRGGAVWQHAARLTSKIEAKKDGKLRVDNGRWFNPGATVRIRDGQTTEFALVQNVLGNGEIALDRILDNDYEAYSAVVEVLARRPVNVNTARPEVLRALFTNLQIVGKNSRITADEAAQLADLVVETRPFLGLEDFLRRIVLPAGGIEKLPGDAPVVPEILMNGKGFIDPWDAVALYRNALNANDAGLAYSTMPFSFTTRDTYAYELRSTVNAPSGVERFTLIRDEVALITPQRELMQLWARQEDFDEQLRLTNDAPWWMTGPNSTSRWDSGSVPPSRLWAHLGTFEGQVYVPGVTDETAFKDRESPPIPEHVFASREDTSWIQLMPSREDEDSALRKGRILHFDHETKDLEGRYLPGDVVAKGTDDEMVRWTTSGTPLLRSLSLSMWIKPRALGDAKYLDIGGSDASVDRISLLTEGADLVLRVIDGVGDHRDTAEKEVGEMRFAINGANSPGLPADIWSHVELDVRGNRPSQMHMLVNGLAYGVRTPGLTRLSAAVPQNATVLPVESVEGFPATCTVRVGTELVEVRVEAGALRCDRVATGKLAGFGGKIARERYSKLVDTDTNQNVPDVLLSPNFTADHPAGTPVELFGYSLPIASDVPSGKSQLAGDLGRFRVSRAIAVVGGQGSQGDPISLPTPFGSISLGYGMKGVGSGVTGLTLACADDGMDTQNPTPAADFMSAFNRDGGYAMLVQESITRSSGPTIDAGGSPVGGIEIIRYSGYQGTTLTIGQRGITQTQLPNLAGMSAQQQAAFGGTRSFITAWNPSLNSNPPTTPIAARIEAQLFVVPISLGVPGSGAVNGFLSAKVGDSRFAQITHVDDAENTEWVRYDWFDTNAGQIVRDDPNALTAVYRVLTHDRSIPLADPQPGGGGGPGSGGGVTPPGGIALPGSSTLAAGDASASLMTLGALASVDAALTPTAAVEPAAPVAVEPASLAAAQQQQSNGQWDPRIGRLENLPVSAPISRAVETVFQFRGVFGTYSHMHASGTVILPVFMTQYKGIDGGRPGRLDAAFLVGSSPDHPGWPLRVHRAHVPAQFVEKREWTQPPGQTRPITVQYTNPQTNSPIYVEQEAYLRQYCYVALQDKSPEIMLAGTAVPNSGQFIADSRLITRLVCYPSGERPRLVSKLAIGGGAGGAPGVVPHAVVDEVVFGDAQFARKAPNVSPEDMNGASLVVRDATGEDGDKLYVAPKTVRVALQNTSFDHKFLSDMPQDAGLLRVGDEILAYKTLDADQGEITVATNGRGLLGTRRSPHQAGEPAMFLEHRVCSVLSGPIGAGDATLGIVNIEDFPHEGTVLIGEELIHYTRLRENALEMPRASSVPGKMDQRGDGLFRGRFGTVPAAHAAGEAVIVFPTRYLDRWSDRADAPELSYFGLEIDQPAAFWGSCFFSKIDTDSARIGVLQRTKESAAWDADTDTDPNVKVFWQGEKENGQLPIQKQSDKIEWRVFVQYMAGAFTEKTGLGQGWKQTPRLKLFTAFYHAPSQVLRSVER
jgi:hypothetical protein